MKNLWILGIVLAALGAGLAGCSTGTQTATPEQAKAFEGGPMPDEWKEKMAGAQKAGPPPSVPAPPTGQ